MSAQGVQVEDERINKVKNWSEPKSVCDNQVFLGFANFYWRFIQSFSKIAGPLTLMLRTTSSTSSSTILQSSIDVANEDKVSGNEIDGNKTNLSNPSAFKKSTRAGYLTSKSVKKGNANTKKVIKAVKGSNYLILVAKKAFNLLQYAFI